MPLRQLLLASVPSCARSWRPARRVRRPALWRTARATVLAAAAWALAACTTSGIGQGASPSGALTATFAWEAEGPTRGAMTAMLSTGETYRGPFFQITRETRIEELHPLWVGWAGRGRWHRWGAWGPEEFRATQYTGRVLANLAGPRGQMRCNFRLIRPSSGMAGGGAGRCQLPDGAIIHADFPPR